MRARTVKALAGIPILVVALGLGTVACSDSGDSGDSSSVPVFHEGDTVTVKNGQEFVISLTANPSTGYTWDAGKTDKVKYLSSRQVNATNNAIGAPGTQELKFKAVASGDTTLELAYARQFEGGVPPAETTSFDVTIKS